MKSSVFEDQLYSPPISLLLKLIQDAEFTLLGDIWYECTRSRKKRAPPQCRGRVVMTCGLGFGDVKALVLDLNTEI
ncbi:feruloyl [Moniliophthora roreri]|nr:feruloyl [Moniliophthora roreri]